MPSGRRLVCVFAVAVSLLLSAPGEASAEISGDAAASPRFRFATIGSSVGGAVFQDVDADGEFDGGEGVDGAPVRLTGDSDGDGADDVDAVTLTAGGGLYEFDGLADGDYRLHVRWEGFTAGAPLQNLSQVADPDALLDDGTAFSLAGGEHLADRDFGYLRRPQPGVEKESFWRLHPALWPLAELTVGGVAYTREQALDLMWPPGGRGDHSLILFSEVVAAKLNVALGNDAVCIAATIAAADTWLAGHPPGSGVRPSSGAWKNGGKPLHAELWDYDRGKLCAPKAGLGAFANRLPVAEDLDLTTPEETALPVELVATDADLDALSWAVVVPPAHGTLTGTAPSLVYTPDAGFAGSDLFVVRADDGQDGSNAAWVSVLVERVNDAPQAADDAYALDEGATLVVAPPGVLGNDVEPDGDPLTLTLIAPPSHGSLALAADGSFTYTHDGGETASDSFVYEICDDGLPPLCDTATVSLTIQPVNDPPTVVGESYRAAGNTELAAGGAAATGSASASSPLSLLANDSDADGPAPLSVVAGTFATAAGGSVTLFADGGFVYLPTAGFTGSDSFAYQVSDGAAVVGGTAAVEVAAMVWYVDNQAAPGGDGRSASPFDTLAAAEAASAPGEIVFVFTGDGTTTGQDAGFDLDGGEQLVGQGVALVVDFGAGPTSLVAAGTPPAITGPGAGVSGVGVGGVAVRGLRVVAPGGDGVFLSSVAGATIEAVTVETPADAGVEATGGSGLSFLGGGVVGGTVGVRLAAQTGANEIAGATFVGPAGDAVSVSAAGAGILGVSVRDSEFFDVGGESLQVSGATGFSGQADVAVRDNVVEVGVAGFGGGVVISGQEQGTYVLDIAGNRFGPAAPSADAGPQGAGLIVVDANDQSTVRGTIAGNVVRNAAGSAGIVLFVDEDAALTVVAQDNVIENVGSDGIQAANFCFGTCAADFDLVLDGNVVDAHSQDGGAFVGGVALFGSGGTGAGSGTCVAFDLNTVGGTPPGFFDYYLDDFGAANPLLVEGPGNAAVTAADVQSLNGQPGAVVGIFGNVTFSGGIPCERP
jgi:hypothetical protein